MKRANFFGLAIGMALAGSMWFIRELPMWDDRIKYSDDHYNAMLSITGALIIIGCVGIVFGISGVIKHFTEKK